MVIGPWEDLEDFGVFCDCYVRPLPAFFQRRTGNPEHSSAVAVRSETGADTWFDDRIASVPYVNWRENPDGIDGARGVQIAGGLTAGSGRSPAAVLSAGPLPQLTRPSATGWRRRPRSCGGG